MTPLALFLLGCVMVFLGSIQTSFSALMRLSLRLRAERGGRNDRLGYYLDDPLQLFIPLRVLIGLSTVLAAVLIARLTTMQDAGSIAAFFVSLGVFVVFCEQFLPMLVARRDPEGVLDVLLPAIHPVTRALRPLTRAMISLGRHDRDSGADGDGDESGQTSAGTDAADDKDARSEEAGRELLQSIVDFTETIVREVMTPRPDIAAIPAEATLDELRTLFREEHYSRIPVYRDTLDDIVGVMFVKDLVTLPHDADLPLSTLMRAPLLVPESKRVSELLKEMQVKQAQMAIVLDEHGGTAGLVTVEDLLEEIVGEIRDEYDVEGDTVTDEGNGTFVFSGKVNVDEVLDRLGVEIEREGFETLGGYLLSHLGRMPYVGEAFAAGELDVEVIEVDRRRIAKVRVRRRDGAAAPTRE